MILNDDGDNDDDDDDDDEPSRAVVFPSNALLETETDGHSVEHSHEKVRETEMEIVGT